MKHKTTKQRLMELAAINNPFLGEAVDPNFPVKLTINIKAKDLLDKFDYAVKDGFGPKSGVAPMEAQEFNRFAKEVQDDLQNWFEQNGGEWFADGLNFDMYTDFYNYED